MFWILNISASDLKDTASVICVYFFVASLLLIFLAEPRLLMNFVCIR